MYDMSNNSYKNMQNNFNDKSSDSDDIVANKLGKKGQGIIQNVFNHKNDYYNNRGKTNSIYNFDTTLEDFNNNNIIKDNKVILSVDEIGVEKNVKMNEKRESTDHNYHDENYKRTNYYNKNYRDDMFNESNEKDKMMMLLNDDQNEDSVPVELDEGNVEEEDEEDQGHHHDEDELEEDTLNTEFVSSDEDNIDLKKRIDEFNNYKNDNIKGLLPEDIKVDDTITKKIFLEIFDIIKNRKKQIEKMTTHQNSEIYKNIHKYNTLLNKCNMQINFNQKRYAKLRKQMASINTSTMIKKSESIYKTIRE